MDTGQEREAVSLALAALAVSRGLQAWLGILEPTWWQLASDEPHSQMPLWLLGAAAAASAVLAACVWLVDRFPRATWPLVAGTASANGVRGAPSPADRVA